MTNTHNSAPKSREAQGPRDPYLNRKVFNPITKLKGRTTAFKNGEYRVDWADGTFDDLGITHMRIAGISFED